ncbi:SMP-30/gluconolactonase/LRE family protein [Amycolatopsis sp. cg5]|uniref:SMP-30/gluconolactonase/LRE family protein n=1 Tax=Amycolatopsis sp. cg5 TaxID=3238802 RepID=UPI0035253352
MTRRFGAFAAIAALALSLFTTPVAQAHGLPATIPLPNGFMPEGIEIGGHTAYLGSRADGSLYRVNLLNGKGEFFSKGPGPGSASLGLKLDDRGRLFVSGAASGQARIVDARTGAVIKTYQLTTAASTFINDVILTEDAAWFTDTRSPVLYKLPLGRHGSLPAQSVTVPLTGAGLPTAAFGNGIVTSPDGKSLLVVADGKLLKVDPKTGATTLTDLGGEVLTNGDGLLRQGNTLYVVQNRLNTVAKFALDRTGSAGKLLKKATDPRFDVPTTVAPFAGRLYLPNARFSSPQTPDTTFDVIAIPRF